MSAPGTDVSTDLDLAKAVHGDAYGDACGGVRLPTGLPAELRVSRRTRGRYWLLVGDRLRDLPYQAQMLTVGGKLAVFSFKEEAEAFLESRAPGSGLGDSPDGRWRVREFSAGELVSALYGFPSGFGSVALDPLPEAADRAMDALVSVSREDFVKRVRRAARAQGAPSFPEPLEADQPRPGRDQAGWDQAGQTRPVSRDER